MERNRRKPKNDKWVIYGLYKVKKDFKSCREVWLGERKYLRDYKDGKKDWLRVYLYHIKLEKKKASPSWAIMTEGVDPLQIEI